MPWLIVNQIRLLAVSAVPTPVLALEVQRAGDPGAPGGSNAHLFTIIPRLFHRSALMSWAKFLPEGAGCMHCAIPDTLMIRYQILNDPVPDPRARDCRIA